MVLKRLADVAEVVGLTLAAVMLVLLLTRQPDRPATAVTPVPGPAGTVSLDQGRALYGEWCASCHGDQAEGVYGPALGGERSTRTYPDIAAQVAVVQQGRGQMRAFSSDLAPAQIEAILAYVRSLPTPG